MYQAASARDGVQGGAWSSAKTATIGSAFILIVTGLNLAWVFARLFVQVPIGANEGWNAIHAARALSGLPLYPAADSFMFNNYPPLSFYIVGAVGVLLGDNIIAGRVLSLLATLAIGVNIGIIVRNLGGTVLYAIFAGCLWLGIVSKSYLLYVGVNDPQLLAFAVMTAGFALFTYAPQRTVYLALAALVMVVAGFIKHNELAMPLACTAWLAWYDRKALLRWLGFSLLFLAIGFAVCLAAYGPAFFHQLMTPRTVSLYNVVSLLGWLQGFVIPMAVWILFVRAARPTAEFRLVSLLLVFGCVAFVVTRIGEGVNINCLFDWIIAACIAAGVLLSRLDQSRLSARFGVVTTEALIVGALCLRLVLLPSGDLIRFVTEPRLLDELLARQAAVRADVAWMAQQRGPAMCDELALCYWSGQTSGYDQFNAGQAFLTGKRSEAELARQITAGAFPLIAAYPGSVLIVPARAAGLTERAGASGSLLFTAP